MPTNKSRTVEYPVKDHVDLVVGYKTGRVFLKASTKTGTKFLEGNACDLERELLPVIMTGYPLTTATRSKILCAVNERFVKWHDARRLPT